MVYNISINKAAQSVQVDFASLPDNVKSHIIEYGIKQKLNDKHSQIKADDKNAAKVVMELVHGLLDDWKAGKVTATRQGSLATPEQKARWDVFFNIMKGRNLNGERIVNKKNMMDIMERNAEVKTEGDVITYREKVLAAVANTTPDASKFLQDYEAAVAQILKPAQLKGEIALEV